MNGTDTLHRQREIKETELKEFSWSCLKCDAFVDNRDIDLPCQCECFAVGEDRPCGDICIAALLCRGKKYNPKMGDKK